MGGWISGPHDGDHGGGSALRSGGWRERPVVPDGLVLELRPGAVGLRGGQEEGWRLESAECWLVSGNPILLSGQPAKPILAHELNGPLNGLNGARNGLDAVLFHPFRQFKRGFDRLNGSTVYSTAQVLNRTGWRRLPFRRV